VNVRNDQDILRSFGQRVRARRKAMKLSQANLAAACGLDRTYVGGIERGERNVALRNIRLIALGLGVTVSRLLEGL